QLFAVSDFAALTVQNPYGDLPLVNGDPATPNEKYFAHVDWIVRKAAEKGLVRAGLLSVGDTVLLEKWGKGPVIFPVDKPEISHAWGRYLGARYKSDENLI